VTHSSSTSLAARRGIRTGFALTGATLALLALAGCAPESGAEPSASATPSATATASAEPTADATASAEPTEAPAPPPAAEGAAVDMTCDEVLTADDVYSLNPNLSPDPGYAPTSDTAVTATTYNGLSCGWLNNSSGAVLEVSIALPNETLANSLKDTALTTGGIVPTYGSPPEVEGYFSAETTTAQVFTRGYWVSFIDASMIEPGDAEPVLNSVLGNL
jgi:hypothetical protein